MGNHPIDDFVREEILPHGRSDEFYAFKFLERYINGENLPGGKALFESATLDFCLSAVCELAERITCDETARIQDRYVAMAHLIHISTLWRAVEIDIPLLKKLLSAPLEGKDLTSLPLLLEQVVLHDEIWKAVRQQTCSAIEVACKARSLEPRLVDRRACRKTVEELRCDPWFH
jgi:hypothetical protein